MDVRVFAAVLLLGVAVQVSFSIADFPKDFPGPTASGGVTVLAKRYTINLDLPPKQRWNEILIEYGDDFRNLLKLVKTMVPGLVLDLLAEIGLKVETRVPYPYNYEIMGIAEGLDGVTVGEVLLGNYLYELTAFSKGPLGSKVCTSIVAEATNGTIFHGRNLDYSLVGLLRNMTITVDFVRGGKVVYTGTTFAGYIGLLTGQKPHKYTISLDERDRGEAWMNAAVAVVSGLGAVAAFRIRDTLDNESLDFDDAVKALSDKPLIAPCYIIVGGAKSKEGAVITRERMHALDVWKINPENGTWFLVETNYDHWDPAPKSDDRRDPAIKAVESVTRSYIGFQSIFDILSIPPVLNEGTTYTVVMSAAQPQLYNTWIRFMK